MTHCLVLRAAQARRIAAIAAVHLIGVGLVCVGCEKLPNSIDNVALLPDGGLDATLTDALHDGEGDVAHDTKALDTTVADTRPDAVADTLADTSELASDDTADAADTAPPVTDCPSACSALEQTMATCWQLDPSAAATASKQAAPAWSRHAYLPAPRSTAIQLVQPLPAASFAARVRTLKASVALPAVVKASPRYQVVVIDQMLPSDARERLAAVFPEPSRARETVRALRDAGRRAVVLPQLAVRFQADVVDAQRVLAEAGGVVVAPLPWGDNGFVVAVGEGDVFAVTESLARRADVLFAEPDMLRTYALRQSDPYFSKEWHLADAPSDEAVHGVDISAELAWTLTQGDPTVKIAINDDGVDLRHPDITFANGINEPNNIVAALDGDCCWHGTSVAGVAAATGYNDIGVRGVCPACSVMPVFGFVDWELIIDTQVANSLSAPCTKGAVVVNNSWGPPDGEVAVLDFPSFTELLASLSGPVDDALQYCETSARGGLGTVIVFAAGNGNEVVNSDPFVMHPLTVAVAAVDDQNRKAYYSDFGSAVDVAAPSSGGVTSGQWSTDALGSYGMNPGNSSSGDAAGDYTNSFGGTSGAAPVVAGVVGLMAAANPTLTAAQLRAALRASADRIDPGHGQYDAAGHSPFYGYGKVNAYKAVRAVELTCTPLSEELCNGVDDTCDGVVDEGCVGAAACAPCREHDGCASGLCARPLHDTQQYCLDACQNGACAAGLQCVSGICMPANGRCSACAATESCNGLDDNCDGAVDEGGVCHAGNWGQCTFDAACAAGESCVGGLCTPACTRNAQCRRGQTCAPRVGNYGELDGTSVCGWKPVACQDEVCWQVQPVVDAFVSCVRGADSCDAMGHCFDLDL